MTGMIFNIMRYSIHDGPGIRTTVFFKGCPLRCVWCHNPESISPRAQLMYRADRCVRCGACQEACPHGNISRVDGFFVTVRDRCRVCGACAEACYAEAREIIGRERSADDVMQEIEKDIPFFEESGGGVTFSGGEPLLQHRFLRELLEQCRGKHIHTAVDTSGFAPWPVLEPVAANTDLFLYDLKHIDDGKHHELTGVSNALILENLRRLSAFGAGVIVRMPIVPGFNDDTASIDAAGRFLSCLPGFQGVHLLPYHRAGMDKYEKLNMVRQMPDIPSAPDDVIHRTASRLELLGIPVTIGG